MATVDLDRVRALTFDVGGTVFDWHHTIRDEVAELANAQGVDLDAAQFANDWRRRMFELLFQMRAGEIERTNADACTASRSRMWCRRTAWTSMRPGATS